MNSGVRKEEGPLVASDIHAAIPSLHRENTCELLLRGKKQRRDGRKEGRKGYRICAELM
jgi:hypothetical protein